MIIVKVLSIILAGIIGYLLGSANSSMIVGKIYGIDIREHGSGNAGTTNVLRVLGKKAALFVLIGDFAKGVAAYWLGFALAGNVGAMAGGTAAILGHNWPVYFKFRGGRGVLTSLAVVLMMDWKVALTALGVFVIIVAATRYVSLGSMIAAAFLPISAIVYNRGIELILFTFVIGLLIIVMHRQNFIRITKGTESKLGKSKAVLK